MAWIVLLNGYDYKSIVDSSMIDKIDVLLENIDNIKEYQELKKISTDKKLLFNIKLNAYENELDIFFGEDLYPDRQIYQTKTISSEIKDNLYLEEFKNKIDNFIKTYFQDIEFTIVKGIVLNQFD